MTNRRAPLAAAIMIAAVAIAGPAYMFGDRDTTQESLLPAPRSSASASAYDRDLFGTAWTDVDRNGCDTRNDVLNRDLVAVITKPGTDGCKVLSGRLMSPYTGELVDVDESNIGAEIHIDHIVPLSWAWDNGASSWTVEQRTVFANDPINLLAVDASSNSSKSDSGPADWLPAHDEAACSYVESFGAVIDAYQLTLPERDDVAMRAVDDSCR